MLKTVISGLLLAVFGALTVVLGGALGLDLDHVALLGTALGAVIGLVPDRSAVGRVIGFLLGVVVAWVSFALRAAVLPDSASGRAVATFVAVVACLVICAAALRRIPLWSTLVGMAAVVGAYESVYTNAPAEFLRESPVALTTVVLAAAMGYLAASLVGPDLVTVPSASDGESPTDAPPAVDSEPARGRAAGGRRVAETA